MYICSERGTLNVRVQVRYVREAGGAGRVGGAAGGLRLGGGGRPRPGPAASAGRPARPAAPAQQAARTARVRNLTGFIAQASRGLRFILEA